MLVYSMVCLVVLLICEELFLYCELTLQINVTLWCILLSYLDFHNAKQSGILHSVDRKLKDES